MSLVCYHYTTSVIYIVLKNFRRSKVFQYHLLMTFYKVLLTWWAGLDSNQRKEDLLDLQSSHFNHLSTYPILLVAATRIELVLADRKSAVLTTIRYGHYLLFHVYIFKHFIIIFSCINIISKSI